MVAVFKFRPAGTLKVAFGDEEVLTTAVHRFWKAGAGWVAAKDLKPGDVVRTLGGSVAVRSIEPDMVRQVFNLEVEGSSDYFVGRSAILAHDNTAVGAVAARFDAVAAPR